MGDDGFAAFVAAESARLGRVALLLTGDPVAAEDIVQTSLVRVLERWPRVSRMDNPGGYATRIVVNEARGQHRRARRDLSAAGRVEAFGDPADAWSQRADLSVAVLSLPPRQRAVIVLRFYLDLSEREVAATLGCRPGTVKSQTSKALAKLRALLPAHEEAR